MNDSPVTSTVELETSRGPRHRSRLAIMSDSAVVFVTREHARGARHTVVQVHLRLVLEWGASEALIVPGQVAWLTDTEGLPSRSAWSSASSAPDAAPTALGCC